MNRKNIRLWAKNGRVFAGTGFNLEGVPTLVCTCIPAEADPDISGLWDSFKKGISWTGSKVKKGTKKAAGKLEDVVTHPAFAQVAVPAAATALGVPPAVTLPAMRIVNSAMQGDEQALGKVANVAQQAAQANPAAMNLQAVMSMYHRMMKSMQQFNPYALMQQQMMMPPPYGGMPFYGMPSYGMPQMPQMFPQAMPQPGMTPFILPQLPGIPGMTAPAPRVSGWLYNVPYRSNLAAKSIDTSNPFHLLRGMYNRGMAA